MKKNGEYVGVDDKFIPEDEKYVDESVLGDKEESERKIKKIAKGIGIGYLIFLGIVVAIIISVFIFVGSMFFKTGKMFNKGMDIVSGQTDGTESLFDDVGSQIKSQMDKDNVDFFNFDYTYLQGEHKGADYRLDKIITNNKTNSAHIITVVYNGISATTEDEILSIKKSLDNSTNYYYSLDYDSNGYINKVTIKDI